MTEDLDIKKRPLKIEDLKDVSILSGASLSADGRFLAYVTTKVVVEENCHKDFISVVDFDTNNEPLMFEGSAPQWSPVSNEIAYLADYRGVNYLWIYSLNDDVKRRLAPIYESHYFMGHLALKNFAWSSNGLHIAYVSAVPFLKEEKEDSSVKVIDRLLYKTKGGRGRPVVTDDALSHVWIVPVNGDQPQLVTTGAYNEHSISWSPDSTKIAFISNRSTDPDNNQLHDLWSVDLLSQNITRHTENFGTVYQPAWSPDGSSIAFLATLSKVATNDSPAEDTRLYIADLAGRSIRCLTQSFDRRIEQISWHSKADVIYFTAGNEGTTSIYSVGINADDVEHVEGEACHILEYAINKAGDKICFIRTDTTNLTEIFLHDLSSKISRQITNNSGRLLQHCQ
ncbi:MAG: family peptidase, partial [Segetibacter sp.]|nr:family peptidase [Segetibacter sp.]